MRRVVLAGFVVVLTGCSVPLLPKEQAVPNAIKADLAQAATLRPRAEPPPVSSSVSNSLLPPLRVAPPRPAGGRELEQRFNLRVTEAPIGQVLQSIVQDTPYSILLSPRTAPPSLPVAPGAVAIAAPALPDSLTVNLKDVTVFEALDAVREIYGYEYVVDGTRIYVHPPELRTKLYQVNYVLGQRRGVSDVQVIGGASASNSGSNGANATGLATSPGNNTNGSSGYASIQASAMSSVAKADIWGEMEDAGRTVLGCQVGRAVVTSRSGQGGGAGAATTGGSNSSSGSNSSRADVSFVGETQVMERMRGGEGCPAGRAMTVNGMSGTVVVRGLPHELRQIEQLLRSLQLSIERQVIIEAKIIDVDLNEGSQQGINWSLLRHGAFRGGVGADPFFVDATNSATRGQIPAGTTLGDIVGSQLLGVATQNAFTAGLGIAFQTGNFSALLNFLETQGTVHVLSSPRISTLNNQKAVLKVGSEEPFVTSVSGGSAPTISGGVVVPGTAPNISYQPFFAGISLDVTPQVDENDNVTLHVRSMVNSIVEREKIALLTTSTRVPFAVNNISETDSVVKTRDGQIIVIGGLMTESSNDARQRVPVAGDVPVVGALFGRSNRSTSKRELVILLKPTVVKGDETWANDINASRGRIERMNSAPQRSYPQ